MDSFELNKILGAVLGTLLFVMGVGFLAEAIYHPIEDRGPGYALPEPEVAEAGAATDAAPEVPLATLLASASAERGAAATRKCQSCHTFGEGEPAKQGPNLYGIVGNTKAHMEGFSYSDILLQQKAEGQTWTYENLNSFLTNPKAYAPGTKMSFAGVKAPEERADILAYLQTLSSSPVPFPTADAAPAADAAAPAEAAPAASGETTPGDTVPSEVTNPAQGGDVTAPTAPAAAVETPTTTQSDTPIVGTPVQSTTPAAPGSTTPTNSTAAPTNSTAAPTNSTAAPTNSTAAPTNSQ